MLGKQEGCNKKAVRTTWLVKYYNFSYTTATHIALTALTIRNQIIFKEMNR